LVYLIAGFKIIFEPVEPGIGPFISKRLFSSSIEVILRF